MPTEKQATSRDYFGTFGVEQRVVRRPKTRNVRDECSATFPVTELNISDRTEQSVKYSK
jgi:hypothetical protein